jgi:vacuolar-type H+-ATPase subunit B/Vma2
MCPNQWREIISGSEALCVIIQQLKINHKLNQGKRRKDRMEELKKIRKDMEEEADLGRPGRININIMGKKKGKENISVDNVIERLTILTDEQEVHHSLTRSFEKSFARQEHYSEGFMNDNIDIDWLLLKDNFMTTYANKGIENEDIELIYEGVTRLLS